ncbi:PH domain-containing protein [Pseudarthrobacter sp. J75]|uniref:PH domain-containing protein n=1 Tax=unclassified Pseudarthrobacter TaxID=2647000 RepID=UPI002E808D5C|nr:MULTISPECIES: PH domain-containing protein [unclassified Pseudarthrobacter]MEE2522007.1 PH domain-containing protein [Pseudarthrobacter sp. J47]MEE2528932.1 PH domain-containing protein [Pseudarthrobacter sp. J75]
MPIEAIDPEGIAWQRVSPKFLKLRLVSWAIGSAIALLVLSLPLVFVQLGWWSWPPLWVAVALPVLVLVIALWKLVLIPRQVRAIGYAEREDDLLIRGGIIFQRTMVVPYGRMQYVDIGVGPVERSLGLCTLKLHTAAVGTNATIPGLPAAEGARLREQLTARGEARLAGL